MFARDFSKLCIEPCLMAALLVRGSFPRRRGVFVALRSAARCSAAQRRAPGCSRCPDGGGSLCGPQSSAVLR